jgi:hypothetical protein
VRFYHFHCLGPGWPRERPMLVPPAPAANVSHLPARWMVAAILRRHSLAPAQFSTDTPRRFEFGGRSIPGAWLLPSIAAGRRRVARRRASGAVPNHQACLGAQVVAQRLKFAGLFPGLGGVLRVGRQQRGGRKLHASVGLERRLIPPVLPASQRTRPMQKPSQKKLPLTH